MTRLYPLPMFRTALKKYVLFLVFFSITFPLFSQQPAIERVDPFTAPTQMPVMIYGSNFKNVTGVTIAGAPAFSFQVLSPTMIQARVGQGDEYNYNIEVSTTAGTASYSGFRFMPPPRIFSVTPDSAGPSQEVLITGSGFTRYWGDSPENTLVSNVYFGTTPAASFTVISYDTIKAIVGPGASGYVEVQSYADFGSYYPFTYLPSPYAPIITSFSPKYGDTDTVITIIGKYFTGATKVHFGEDNTMNAPAASFTVVSDSVIKAVVGYGATGPIKVLTPLGMDTIHGFIFRRPTQAPVISSFSPTSGRTDDYISIFGSNFTDVRAVTIGDTPVKTFSFLSDGWIHVRVGQGATGAVKVITPVGTGSRNGFTYIPRLAPVITSFYPTSGTTNDVIKIRGRDLYSPTSVSIGGAPAKFYTTGSDTVINATVGYGSSGEISVTTALGTATLSGFTYAPSPNAPIIRGFSPTSAGAGDTVWIHGYFNDYQSTTFGDVPARSVWFVKDTLFYAIVDSGATGDVVVTTYYGADTLGGFTFIQPPAPAMVASPNTKIINYPHTASSSQVILYPNPARNYVWMKHPVSTQAAQVQVVNAMGTVLKIMRTDPGVSQTQVNLNGISTGYYRIVWTDGKVIKSAGVTIVE